MAATLGAPVVAIFALQARVISADQVGGVAGIVGAAGGVFGFVWPLVMGADADNTGSYAFGFVLAVARAA
jgi:NNP family nitrate/nitrite transporter-like MFS transporter